MTIRIPFHWLLAALLLLSAAIGVLALPRAMHALAEARGRLAAARQAQRGPAPAIPAEGAADPSEAERRLRAAALAAGLLVETVAPRGGSDLPPGCVALAASGEGRAALRFAAAVESAAPPIRFVTWRLAADGGVVRLTATACPVAAT